MAPIYQLSKESMLDLSHRKTQIVATIGPASESEETLKELIGAGLNVARFNTKHNLPEWHQERILRVRKVAKELGTDTKVLLDLQGPEVRIAIPGGTPFDVKKDEQIAVVSDAGDQQRVIVVPADVISSMEVGHQILLADGACEFTVTEKTADYLKVACTYDCTVKQSKTMNTPGVVLNMPALTEKDLSYITSLHDTAIDYVALSFVRTAADIANLRAKLAENRITAQIVAKIENQTAIENLDEIIAAADAVMVARGDLGVELPFYEVPHWQKIIIQKCNAANKFVITATQMLLSMVENPRPTRAEVSDVANAVYDHTNAVMLSEETTIGKFPVKVVQTQAMIVAYHEQFV